MASNSRPPKPSKTAVEQVMTVTGLTKDQAKYLLTVCQGDVQMAINFHLEEGGSGVPLEGPAMASTSSQVRDPIPPQQEVLVEESEFSRGRIKRGVHSVFDTFRDFQVETRRQEELMAGTPGVSSKKKNLEDLFRPPMDLLLQGTFIDARDVGVSHKKWLMVNVQNVLEFSCQILNRDIWSDQAIRTILKEEFIFWQVYSDSAEGQRYSAFYNVTQWPYVAIIDPRTGECMRVWNKIDSATFCDSILEFLCTHQYEEQPATKRAKTSGEESQNGFPKPSDSASHIPGSFGEGSLGESSSSSASTSTSSAPSVSTNNRVTKSIVDANEDEQLAAAIRASLADRSGSEGPSPPKREIDTVRLHLGVGGGAGESECRFMLRYPDGTREILIVSSSAPVKALTTYVGTKGYPQDNYMLVVNFPRRVLSNMDPTITLEELNLHRQETVFVELR